MKTIENKGFLTTSNAMGRSVPVKAPARFIIVNKINGFVHTSYGTALKFHNVLLTFLRLLACSCTVV